MRATDRTAHADATATYPTLTRRVVPFPHALQTMFMGVRGNGNDDTAGKGAPEGAVSDAALDGGRG